MKYVIILTLLATLGACAGGNEFAGSDKTLAVALNSSECDAPLPSPMYRQLFKQWSDTSKAPASRAPADMRNVLGLWTGHWLSRTGDTMCGIIYVGYDGSKLHVMYSWGSGPWIDPGQLFLIGRFHDGHLEIPDPRAEGAVLASMTSQGDKLAGIFKKGNPGLFRRMNDQEAKLQ